MTTYTITFDRIGRNHDVDPLTVEASDPDDLAEKLYRAVKPRLASRDVEVLVDLEQGYASIFCGFHSGGRGEIKAVEVSA